MRRALSATTVHLEPLSALESERLIPNGSFRVDDPFFTAPGTGPAHAVDDRHQAGCYHDVDTHLGSGRATDGAPSPSFTPSNRGAKGGERPP